MLILSVPSQIMFVLDNLPVKLWTLKALLEDGILIEGYYRVNIFFIAVFIINFGLLCNCFYSMINFSNKNTFTPSKNARND